MEGERWERLFGDLEAQLAAAERLDADAEIADRTRRERALVSWSDRLGAHDGHPLVLLLRDGRRLRGRVSDLGRDWVLLRTDATGGLRGDRGEVLVPLPAVVGIEGLGARARAATTARRFGLGSALRLLSRDRQVVELVDITGSGTTGTIDVVLADAVELARHAVGDPRRPEHVTGRLLVPFAAIVSVHRR